MGKFVNTLRACARRTKFAIWVDKFVCKTSVKGVIEILCAPFGLCKMLFLSATRKVKREPKYGLGITAIVKNEARYLAEWIEYHRLIGVGKFYIYDNESTDGILAVLDKYIAEGIVEYRPITGKNRQNDAYNDSLNRHRKEVKYMAFIDADEFIYAGERDLLPYLDGVLADKKAAGLVLNWKIFGSSHLTENDGKPVLERFLYRGGESFERNKHVKTICKPSYVLGMINPHYCVYLSGCHSVNVRGEKRYGPFNEEVAFEPACINHYFCKSYEEFVEKRARGKADSLGIRDEREFEEHDVNEAFDDGILKFAKIIKEKEKL